MKLNIFWFSINFRQTAAKNAGRLMFLAAIFFGLFFAAHAQQVPAPIVFTPPNGSSTSNNRPPVTGTSQPGTTVTIVFDGTDAGTTTADANGNFTLTPLSSLSDGTHTVKARATDSGGTTSADSNTNTFNVDTTPPPAPVVVTPADGAVTGNNRPVVSGTAEPLSTVTVIVDASPIGATSADASGNYSLTPPTPLAAGAHTVRARAADAVGNTSPNSAANNFTITAPTAANLSIGGRILTADGRGIPNAIVTLTDDRGNTRTARSSSFGYYRFEEVAAGSTVTIDAAAKGYNFNPRVVNAHDDALAIDFEAQPE